MNTSRPTLRLRQLIDAALADKLSEKEQIELEAILCEDDEAISWFVKYCHLEATLYFEIRSAVVNRRANIAISALKEKAGVDSKLANHRADDTDSNARHKSRPWRMLLSIAASLLVVAGVGSYVSIEEKIFAERQPQPVARLVSTENAKWLGDEYLPGHRFVENESIYLTGGSARLSMTSGVEIALKGPCFISLENAMLIELEEGLLTAQVSEWAHGFTVSTEALQVVDLGTKFAVSAGACGKTETHVLDGQVRVHSPDTVNEGRHSLLLSEGEALRIQCDNKVITKLKANRELYDAELSDIPPFKPIAIYNTGRGLLPGDEDQHWRIVAGPNCPQYQGPQFAVVGKADQRYLSNDPDRSQWISLSSPLRPGMPPNSLFTFQTSFNLDGYDLSSVLVSAQVIADNGVKAIRINGTEVPFEPWNLNGRDQVFNRFYLIDIASGFVTGNNVLEFDVWNGVDRLTEAGNNPLSIRVEWNASGRLAGGNLAIKKQPIVLPGPRDSLRNNHISALR